MTNEAKLEAIKVETKKTIKQIKELHDGNGGYSNPVDMDMVKTSKAMFFEKVLEILRTK